MPSKKTLRGQKKREQKARARMMTPEHNYRSDPMSFRQVNIGLSSEELEASVKWAFSREKLTYKNLQKDAPAVAEKLTKRLQKEFKSNLSADVGHVFACQVADAVLERRIRDGQLSGILAPRGTVKSAINGPDRKLIEEELSALHRKIMNVMNDLKFRVNIAKKMCWECDKLCEKRALLCGHCKFASFCSEECQRSAWESGIHKEDCKFLKFLSENYQHELRVMDATHSELVGEDHPSYPVPLSKISDLFAVGEIGSYEFHEKSGITIRMLRNHDDARLDHIPRDLLPLPSMEKFYTNIGRAARGEWWLFGETNGLPISIKKMKSPSFEIRQYEKELFMFVLTAMMYTDENIAGLCKFSYPAAKNMLEAYNCCDWESIRGLQGIKEALPEDSIKMTATRFFQIYCMNDSADDAEVRQLRREIEANSLSVQYEFYRQRRDRDN